MNQLYLFIIRLFITIYLFSFGNLYSQPSSYIIINKTDCTAQVTAYCTDFSSSSNILGSDDDWSNSCPTGETLCTVTMVLPGATTIYVADYTLPCPNYGSNVLPPSSCYTQNVQWQTISGNVVCNIY